MHFEIYPPVIPNNILTHVQTTSPHFTQEPHLLGKTARRDSPIKLTMEQFERLASEVRKLLVAQSCKVFAVDGQGGKQAVTVEMMDELLKDLQDDEDDLPAEEPKTEEPKAEIKPEEPKVEAVPVAPAPTVDEPKAEQPVEAAPVPETPPTEAPVEVKTEETLPSEAPVVEEPKKKSKGKKTQE